MLREGDFAWAQIKGYPYWPCRVLYKIAKGQKYRVQFFGDNTQGEISSNAICEFENNYQEYSQAKTKNSILKQAIKEAMDELDIVKKKCKIEEPKEEEQNIAVETHETSKEEVLNQELQQENEQDEIPLPEIIVQIPVIEYAQQQELVKIQLEDSKFEIKIKKILKLLRRTDPYATYQEALLLYESHQYDLHSILEQLRVPQTPIEEPLPQYYKIFF